MRVPFNSVIAICVACGLFAGCDGAEGGELLFLSRRSGNGELYLMTMGDSVATNLTGNEAFDGFGAWSPDGERIAFDSDRSGERNRDIYVMDADGSNVRRLTEHPGYDLLPTWSPDGSRIAFMSLRDSDFDINDPAAAPFAAEIYLIHADGADLRRVTDDPAHDQTPAWSPDGRSIVFSREIDGRGQLFIVDIDSGDERRLRTSDTFDVTPAFSPDGREITFSASSGDSAAVLVMNADGSGARRISQRFAANYRPAWSPDGRLICYTVGVDDQWDIWGVDVASGEEFPIVTNPARDESCAWRP